MIDYLYCFCSAGFTPGSPPEGWRSKTYVFYKHEGSPGFTPGRTPGRCTRLVAIQVTPRVLRPMLGCVVIIWFGCGCINTHAISTACSTFQALALAVYQLLQALWPSMAQAVYGVLRVTVLHTFCHESFHPLDIPVQLCRALERVPLKYLRIHPTAVLWSSTSGQSGGWSAASLLILEGDPSDWLA